MPILFAMLLTACGTSSPSEAVADEKFCWWWWCGPSEPSPDATSTVTVRLNECMQNIFGDVDCSIISTGASCTEVVVTNEAGEEVASGQTGEYGSIRFDLAPGRYAVSFLDREDVVAPDAYGASTKAFTVGSDDLDVRIGLHPDAAGALSRCIRTLTGAVEVSCEGELLPTAEQEWRVAVDLVDADGNSVAVDRPFRIYERPGVTFAFDHVAPGSYTLVFHGMDVPDYARDLSTEEEDLLERYGTDHVAEVAIEATLDMPAIPTSRFEVCE